MTNQKNDGIPTPDRAWVISVIIGAAGVAEKRRSVFVSDHEPNHEKMHAAARELGLELEISGVRAELSDDHPDAVIGQLLDVAAMAIHGTISGATVDPLKAWKNEIEHTVRVQARQGLETLRAVDRLAALVEAALGQVRVAGVAKEPEELEAPRPRRDMRRPAFNEDERAEVAAEIAAPPTAGPPPGYDPRRKPNETESDTMHVRGPSNLPGKKVGSEMLTFDGAEFVDIPLPRVGDSLKSMAWMSDIPAPK